MAAGLTLDSGALIAAEKGSRRVWQICKEASERGAPVTVPAPVLAQVWRGNSAVISRLLKGCVIEDLGEASAKRAGELLAKAHTSDIVDAVVVIGAGSRRDAVLTSDPDDIAGLVSASGYSLTILTL